MSARVPITMALVMGSLSKKDADELIDEYRAEVLAEAAEAARTEHLHEVTGTPEDEAYNQGVTDAVAAIGALLEMAGACPTCNGNRCDPDDDGDWDSAVGMYNPDTCAPCPECHGTGTTAGDGGQPADHIVAYRNSDRPGVLLCREHGEGWMGLTPLTSEDLPDGGTCTWGEPDETCGRDVLVVEATP